MTFDIDDGWPQMQLCGAFSVLRTAAMHYVICAGVMERCCQGKKDCNHYPLPMAGFIQVQKAQLLQTLITVTDHFIVIQTQATFTERVIRLLRYLELDVRGSRVWDRE